MIEYIHLINFGIHKNLLLEFSPGKNFIIGENDSGKSTIMRAFDYIINNNMPQKVNYLNNNCKENEAFEIHMGIDGHKISRIKSKTRNEYIINDGNPLTGFSQSVPGEISDIIKFSDVNIQFQKSPPFLLEDSGGEVSRYLNKTIDLDIIDTTFKNINKIKKDCKNEIDKIEKDLEILDNKLENFNYIEVLEKELTQTEFIEDLIIKKEGLIEDSLKILEDYWEFKEGLLSCNLILEKEEKLKIIIKLNSEISNKEKRIQESEHVICDINILKEKLIKLQNIDKKEKRLEKIKKLNEQIIKLSDEFNNKSSLLNLKFNIYQDLISTKKELKITNKLLEKENNIKDLNNLELDIINKEKIIKNGNKDLFSLQAFIREFELKKKELKELEKEYKEKLGDRCPLCKQLIK